MLSNGVGEGEVLFATSVPFAMALLQRPRPLWLNNTTSKSVELEEIKVSLGPFRDHERERLTTKSLCTCTLSIRSRCTCVRVPSYSVT